VRFTPLSSKFANEPCGGIFIVVTDRAAVKPVRVGVEMAAALMKLFPGQLQVDLAGRLFGSAADLARIKAGDDPSAIAASWAATESAWRQTSARYTLY